MNDDIKATGWIGRRVRALRTAQAVTVGDLAGRAGVSAAQLSRIESGDRQPSIGALLSLARELGVTLSDLVAEEPRPEVHVVRDGATPDHHADNGTFTALSGPLPGIQALRLSLTPDSPTDGDAAPAVHDGEEWIHVLTGEVDLVVGDSRTSLVAGDSAHFRSGVPHSLTVPADGSPASVLLVTTGHHD